MGFFIRFKQFFIILQNPLFLGEVFSPQICRRPLVSPWCTSIVARVNTATCWLGPRLYYGSVCLRVDVRRGLRAVPREANLSLKRKKNRSGYLNRISTAPDPQGSSQVDVLTHPYTTAACAVDTTGAENIRQLALGFGYHRVTLAHDVYARTHIRGCVVSLSDIFPPEDK